MAIIPKQNVATALEVEWNVLHSSSYTTDILDLIFIAHPMAGQGFFGIIISAKETSSTFSKKIMSQFLEFATFIMSRSSSYFLAHQDVVACCMLYRIFFY